MSTPVGSSQWMYTSASAFYPYLIDQSLRFNKDDSAYLSRTPSSAGNRDTWTISMWVKRSRLGLTQSKLFGAGSSFPSNHNNAFYMWFQSDDTLRMRNESGGSYFTRLDTTRRFRDVSSWYHIVYVYDSTQATATDRQKLYINGVEETAFDERTDPNLNVDSQVNGTFQHNIGVTTPVNYFDGYMAEVNFIDGTALDATSFGETINGIWVPKQYSGSYGTNGFYLSFADSAAIGDDLSGNTNDFTANNLAASDVVPDSPTNNFATLNAAANFTPATLTEGNLKATPTSSSDKRYHSTFPISSGKWYCEIRIVSTGTRNHIGFWGTENTGSTSVPTNYARLGVGNGSSATSGTFNGTGFTANAGDILTYAFDADDGKLYFGRNAAPTIGATADFTGLASDTYVLGQRETGTLNTTNHFNFGQDDTFAGAITAGGNSDDNGIGTFKYAPPSGFLAMCSANLPEPAIGPNSDTTSDQNFNTVLWSGDSSSSRAITGVGHAPDFVWIKNRSAAISHVLHDRVRGTDGSTYYYLLSNLTNGDTVQTDGDGLLSLDSDGFTLGYFNGANWNTSGDTYVGWNWKAGGTAVSNEDGSITSSVSANTDAGFSIVSWTGNATNPSTVGHGLTSAPEMIILKNRDAAGDWYIGHDDIGWTNRLKFTTTSSSPSITLWNNTAPTSSVFTINSALNFNGNNTIAYCFHSVDGFSKVGKYITNNVNDGTFVYTGFRPKFVMIKRTDGTVDWQILDSERVTYNPNDKRLEPNTTAIEATTSSTSDFYADFLSNGFKLRGNGSAANGGVSATVIYLAFAESPFKYANAR